MDTQRLRYFCVIARTGSLRKAAELLRLSPAALSKALRLLEEEAGVTLTTQSGRGIVVTDEGRALAQKAEALLQQIDALPQTLRETQGSAPPLRLGSFEVFTTHFLPRLTEQLGDRALELHEFVPGHLEQALASRTVDVGITYLPVPHPDLDHVEVGQVRMGVYVRKGAFSEHPFESLPFVVPVQPISGSPNRIRGLDGWPDDRVPRKVLYRVTLMESALALCRQGVAAAYLPTFVVELHNRSVLPELRLQSRPYPRSAEVVRQAVFLIKRKTDPEGSSHRKIARALRAIS